MYLNRSRGSLWLVVGLALLVAWVALPAGTLAQRPLTPIRSVTLNCSEIEKAFAIGFLTRTAFDEEFYAANQTESVKVASSDFALRCRAGEQDTYTFDETKQANDAVVIWMSETPDTGTTGRPQICILGDSSDGETDIDLTGDGDVDDTYFGLTETNRPFNLPFRAGLPYGLETPSVADGADGVIPGATANASKCDLTAPGEADAGQSTITFNADLRQIRRPFVDMPFSQRINHDEIDVVKIDLNVNIGGAGLTQAGISRVQALIGDTSANGGNPFAALQNDVGQSDGADGTGDTQDGGAGPPNRMRFQFRHAVNDACKDDDGTFNPNNADAHSGFGARVDPANPGEGPFCLYKIPEADFQGGIGAINTVSYIVTLNFRNAAGTSQAQHFVTVIHAADTAVAGVQALSVNSIETSNLARSTGPINLTVRGTGVESVEINMFDLSGRNVLNASAQGNVLRFRPLTESGAPLANGIYLYRVTVRGYDGQVIRTEVRKFLVLK